MADEVLDGAWDEDAWWSTTNHGEAVPGVLTPLNWAFWGPVGERATRAAFIEIGALEEARGSVPDDPADRVLGIFHGRVAGKVDFIGEMGDRIPGITGAIMAEGLIGELPADFPERPTEERYGEIGRRMPGLFVQMPERIRGLGETTDAWWREQVSRAQTLDLAGARELWTAARANFEHTLQTQIVSIFAGVQPAILRLTAAATDAGRSELMGPLLAGQGSHAELAVVVDLWAVSRDELTLEEFCARHGYHGPAEGEISSRVWREDQSPVANVAKQYRDQPADQHPDKLAAAHALARLKAQQELLAAVSETDRDEVRRLIDEADRYVPLRGVGKVAFLQNLDVARAASRRIGTLLAGDGAVDDPEDVFFLVEAELLGEVGDASLRPAVAERRALRESYQQLTLPKAWRGRPEVIAEGVPDEVDRGTIRLAGVGASPGVVEGPVRVVTDPTFADVEPGEVLVAPLTDPGWAPIMYCAEALVVDVGGMLSHAAVVARELGLPCVMGTDVGTSLLRTGDLVRVDGNAGTVEVVDPAR